MRSVLFATLLVAGLAPRNLHALPDGWQQRVRYEMDIRLLADRHRLEGRQRLEYHNESPDTLREVYYHLYFNAFQPNSMMAARNRHLPDPDARVVPRIFELGPDEVGFHEVHRLTQDGHALAFDVFDTVLRAPLAVPIPPGGSAAFEMTFSSQVPLQTRRSGRDNREGVDYSMAQWYPKLAQYDERGWHPDPYVGREFYAPFGTFDVRITVPSDYVIGATGVLVNAAEIGHGYAPAPPGPRPDSLTWHFRAENVHDFAWAADPEFRHDVIETPGAATVHLLYLPDVAPGWQPMKDWVPALLAALGDLVGPYPYPQFTVAQAGDGGMEYPQMIFITGRRPPGSLFGVTAHEAAHEWFYGALGSNEADYAWMDEGFTSWAAAEAVAALSTQDFDGAHDGAHQDFLRTRLFGLQERLNTESDWFVTNRGYGTAAYSGGEMLLEMLGYVIGEDARDAVVRRYFREFLFRHPDPVDFERTAEAVSRMPLDWFFEQWTNTTRRFDYAVSDLDARRDGNGWETTVRLRRDGEIVMPADVRITLDDGSERWVNVPLSVMHGHKPVPEGWTVAAPWPVTEETYTVRLTLPARPVRAEIDPRAVVPEADRLDNRSSLPLRTDFLRPPAPTRTHYGLAWRPVLQYASDFGFGGGAQLRGTYTFGRNALKASVKVWPQVLLSGGDEPRPELPYEPSTSVLDGVDYELTLSRPLRRLGPLSTAEVSFQKHLGILDNRLTVSRPLGRFPGLAGGEQRLSVTLAHQHRASDRTFDLHNFPWWSQDHLFFAQLGYAAGDALDRVSLLLETGNSLRPANDRPYGANRLRLHATKGAPLAGLEGRASFTFGIGTDNLAPQKQFRLGSASQEDRWLNDAFRNGAALFEHPVREAHFETVAENGPVAYLLLGTCGCGLFDDTPSGTALLAGNLSLGTPALSSNPWLRPLTFELFSGIGTVKSGEWESPVADAGVGAGYDVAQAPLPRWIGQSDALSQMQLVLKLPLWVSDPGRFEEEQGHFAFRWLLGIRTPL